MSQVEPQDSSPLHESDGWTRRFTAIGARLNEAIELYSGLGFETKLEPAEAGSEEVADSSACGLCFVMTLARTIYTRPRDWPAGEIAAER